MARGSLRRSHWPLRASRLALILLATAPGAAQARDEAEPGLALAASALPPVTALRTAVPAEAMLILDVEVNGVNRGLLPFRLIDNRLWANFSVLREMGLKLESAADPATDPLLLLDQELGSGMAYDAAAQRLAVHVDLARLDVGTHRLNTSAQDMPVAQSATGALLNYDIYANYAGGRLAFDGFGELRAFSGNVLLESTGVYNSRALALGQARLRRLDSTLSWSMPERRLTVRAGDILTRSTSWSRPTRLGGVRVGTDFALQPYLVTAPIPTFFGEATLPSTVDLYIEGLKRYSGSVAPGPFELGAGGNQISGAGTAQLVVTDALGQVTTLSVPFYDTPLLLRGGLTDWAVELGTVRRDYGIRSFAYAGDPVLSASLRRGLSNFVTLEAHGEGGAGLVNGGAGATVLLPFGGVVTGSLAASRNDGKTGLRGEVGYSWTDTNFTISASAQRASGSFADLPTLEGATSQRSREVLNAGYNAESLGFFNASLIRQRNPGEPRETFLSASWQHTLGSNLALSLTGNMGLRPGSARGVFLTVSYVPNDRDHVSANLQSGLRRTSAALSYRRSLPTDGGTAWALDTAYDGSRVQAAGQVDHLGRLGQVTAGARLTGGRASGYAGASGALVALGGDVYASRKVYDGFAVVETAGVADVPVLVHNRPVGRTNGKGKLLVTGLNPYQANRVTIDAANLPAELTVASLDQEAVPTQGAGVAVSFAIVRSSAVLLSLVDEAGAELPVGTMGTTAGDEATPLMVGFGGQLYIERAIAGATVTLAGEAGRCTVRLPDSMADAPGGVLGRQVCRREGE
ncbi:fimbria/pilus outer membrane usher protein [Alteraurantiacibacter buctensis]|uniref:Fimbria/pilus outer membrane usher protein n=1 Tax=Alteraurantiacibacter buctensis TaxID=1503981 RepID=A0A844YX24_9SPHN|nr:fimbria/pilus outer membrane usher protein [Alteraurantiacibacter buctensis]MXO70617.1 fimbria/pilus outer membrane usher protein [Alteraurantiacibacter buctensis]